MLDSINIEPKYISPYIRYVNNYAPARSYTKPDRIIYDFEIMYVANGFVDMYFDEKHYRLNQNDIFYLTPGKKNHVKVDGKSKFRTHCIHFDWYPPKSKNDFTAQEAYISPLTDLERIRVLCQRPIYEPIGIIPIHHIKNAPIEICKIFSQCYYLYSQGTDLSQLRLKSLFIDLITRISATYGNHVNDIPIIHPKIRSSIEYIQTHFREKITLEELSEKNGLSQKYFGALFRSSIGKSFSDYLLDTRISAARELLVATELSVEEIAFSTGFGSIYYFSRRFKEIEKQTPTEFRYRSKTINKL